MSIPLVQEATKDAINTSIIAIKRNIERINMLLGLSNSEEIDTSKFATKEELQQAVTDLQPVDEVAVDNMHSVTSNAVANVIKWKLLDLREGQGNDSSFNVSIPFDSWDEVIIVLKVSSQTHTQVFNRLFVSSYTVNLVECDVLSKYTLLRANLIFSGTNYQQLTVNGIQFRWGGQDTTGIVGLYYR